MNKIKQFIKKYFENFAYFYSYLGNRIFISFGLSIMVGIIDGLGLTMFLPLLQMVDNAKEKVSSEQMGNLAFLIEGLTYIGLNLTLQTVLLVMLFFFCLKGLLKFFEGLYKVNLQQSFIRKIRFRNIDLLSGLKYEAFITNDSGRIQNTLSGEVVKVLGAYRSYFTSFQFGIMVFVYIILAIMANAQFAILVAIGGALTNMIFKVAYKKTKTLSKSLTKESHAFQGLLLQEVTNFKYLKASGLLVDYGKRLKSSISKIEQDQKRLGILSNVLASIREPIIIFVVVSVILIQVNLLSQNLGVILLSLLFFYRALTFLMNLQSHWNTFLTVSGSLENMTDFCKDLSSNQERKGGSYKDVFKKELFLDNVSFSYNPDTLILKQITLKINKNETLAFVGESGSGKTTIMNILTGLLSPSTGGYFIDGTSSNSIDMKTFQKRIGYITQEPVIFNDTIFNNITFWDLKTPETEKRFQKALELASINDFVNGLPQKENAELGNNGILISGGQKQRISIARELYKDVDILFMDEATSALDSEAERIIQENIDNLKGKYTIIIIAHRLSTVKNADRIVFLKNGIVENIGNFEQLKKLSPGFCRLVTLQEIN